MVEITKQTRESNDVEVIVFNGKKWLNETNIKDQLKGLDTRIRQYNNLFRKIVFN